MTLILFDGFDNYSLLPKSWMTGLDMTGGYTGRDGSSNGCVGFYKTSGSPHLTCSLPSAINTLICGYGVQYNTTTKVWAGRVTGSSTQQMYLEPHASGSLILRNSGGTQVATSPSGLISTGAWFHLQVKWVPHTSTGSVVVKINDAEVINYTGATSGTTATVDSFQMTQGATSSAGRSFMDDLWVCDEVDATATQGRPNNAFLGDLAVVTLLPSSDGDTIQWTPSTGSNYAAVDENPVNSTDYVSTSTSTNRDLYAMTDLPGNATTVFAVRTSVYAQKSDAGSSSIQITAKENATTTPAAANALSTSWTAIHDPILAVRPSDSGLWTVSDVNSLQVGVDLV